MLLRLLVPGFHIVHYLADFGCALCVTNVSDVNDLFGRRLTAHWWVSLTRYRSCDVTLFSVSQGQSLPAAVGLARVQRIPDTCIAQHCARLALANARMLSNHAAFSLGSLTWYAVIAVDLFLIFSLVAQASQTFFSCACSSIRSWPAGRSCSSILVNWWVKISPTCHLCCSRTAYSGRLTPFPECGR